MATVHINGSDLARDHQAILAKVQEGVEFIVEQNDRPVAVLRPPTGSGRLVLDILREARVRNFTGTLDPEFGDDLEAIIASHDQPWNPPSWD